MKIIASLILIISLSATAQVKNPGSVLCTYLTQQDIGCLKVAKSYEVFYLPETTDWKTIEKGRRDAIKQEAAPNLVNANPYLFKPGIPRVVVLVEKQGKCNTSGKYTYYSFYTAADLPSVIKAVESDMKAFTDIKGYSLVKAWNIDGEMKLPGK